MSKKYKVEACDLLQFVFSSFNDHQLHCVIDLEQHIDAEKLKIAVQMSLKKFPHIRSRFVEGWFRAYWEEIEVNIDEIVMLVRTNEIGAEVEKLVTFRTDEANGPQLRVVIVRDKEKDSICIVINHMLCDGAGFKEYLYALSSIYRNLSMNRRTEIINETGSRSIAQVFKTFSFAERLKILFGSAKFSRYDSGVRFEIEGNINNPQIITHRLSKEKFLAIKSYAKRNGATINDVMLAAYIRALDKKLGCGGISIPCAIDLRKYMENRKAEGICNLASNIIFDIGTDVGDNFNETLLKTKAAMDHEKTEVSCLKTLMLLQMLHRYLPYSLGKKLLARKFENPPVAMTNIGLIDKNKLVFDGANIKDVYISGSIKYKPYFQVAVTTFDNQVTLSVNLYCTENDKLKIKKFLESMEDELMGAVRR